MYGYVSEQSVVLESCTQSPQLPAPVVCLDPNDDGQAMAAATFAPSSADRQVRVAE